MIYYIICIWAIKAQSNKFKLGGKYEKKSSFFDIDGIYNGLKKFKLI